MDQNFKYVVTCFVKQRKGAGLEMNRCGGLHHRGNRSIVEFKDQQVIDVAIAVRSGTTNPTVGLDSCTRQACGSTD